MVKNLVRYGDGYALVIEKPILEILHIDAETPLDVSTDGKVLIVSPAGDEERRRELGKVLEKVNRRFGPALKRLAD